MDNEVWFQLAELDEAADRWRKAEIRRLELEAEQERRKSEEESVNKNVRNTYKECFVAACSSLLLC